MQKGKTPSLLSMSFGHPRKQEVYRISNCKRCNSILVKHTNCYIIPSLINGRSVHKRFCKECILAIVRKSQDELSKALTDFSDDD